MKKMEANISNSVNYSRFACSLTYYGLSLNVGHLFGNIHLNFCLSGIFELIGFAMVVLLLSRVGRKKIYCYSLIVGGMGCLLTVIPVLIGGECEQVFFYNYYYSILFFFDFLNWTIVIRHHCCLHLTFHP